MLFTRGSSKTKEKLNIKARLKFKTAGKHDQGKANKQKMGMGTFWPVSTAPRAKDTKMRSYFIMIKGKTHSEKIVSFVILQINMESKPINKKCANTKRFRTAVVDNNYFSPLIDKWGKKWAKYFNNTIRKVKEISGHVYK